MDTDQSRLICIKPERQTSAERLVPVPFIVGVSRSGTTLLRLMLDAHPELAIPPETHFIPLVARNCADAANPRDCFIETVTSHLYWPDSHVDGQALTDSVAAIDPFNVGDALRSFYRLYAERFGKPRWGDKTPGYVHKMDLIQEFLPEAHFVHIIRDGRDVALSLNEAWRTSGRVKPIQEAAHWWMAKLSKARHQASELSFYLEIRYEDLVLESEATLRRICDFIDLPWNPLMLEYYKTAEERLAELVAFDRKKATNIEQRRAKHMWTTRPPEASRIGRWRTEMSASDRQEFEAIAGELLAELGYDGGSRDGC
jgi:Sulfotransferase family